MSAYWLEWLNLLGRWLHLVVGIAWIGSSFYFVWLDNHLRMPVSGTDRDKGVGGELWAVHGGGFYHAQKYRLAPPTMPETLHWFKWEAYSTWLSGMFLLALIYWYGAEIYLIDAGVAGLSPPTAIMIAVAWIVGGWLVYDRLCRSPIGRNERALAMILVLLIAAAAWGLCQTFSGRGAYIHFGAMLGTIMVANVYFVIIPGQKRLVAAAESGGMPDPADGARGKQRSVHNTYFTLPVLFAMISNHFAMTYAHAYNWLILVALSLAGALIRVWFVARHTGRPSPLPAVGALLLLIGIAISIAPRGLADGSTGTASLDDVRAIIDTRCVPCHAAKPSHPGFVAAPAGVMLETDWQILAEAARIHQQTVVLEAMPIGNLTEITPGERALVASWYAALEGDGEP